MNYTQDDLIFLRDLSTKVRAHVLVMAHKARSSHVGSSLSAVDLLVALYGEIMHIDSSLPSLPSRDRFILSKGHACAAVYAILAEKGFFPKSWLNTYQDEGSRLLKHIAHSVPGVEASTGSLGHGLAIAC